VNEQGSASVLGAAISVVILILGLTVVTVAGIVSAAFAARTAAEAAALAAVSPVVADPLAAARGVAALNRAVLVECRCPVAGAPPPVRAHVVVHTVVDVPFFGELTLPAESSAEYVPEGW
jgi:hypothetical protein